MWRTPRWAVLTLLVVSCTAAGQTSQHAADTALQDALSLFRADGERRKALKRIKRSDDPGMIAPLILSLRYLAPDDRLEVVEVLQRLANTRRIDDDWFQWMVWQQSQSDIQPFAEFATFQSLVLGRIDEGFIRFVYPGVEHRIRLEEIVWGGVSKDGIPALDHPAFIAAAEAGYLDAGDLVFGVAINGDVRAYPYRILDWHEMANDTVGGVPVALAYCTLCASGILFDARIDGLEEPVWFGSSGLLYRSNKLMYDRQTQSLWNQFTGRPVVGVLAERELEARVLPLVTTTWEKWLRQNPRTRVLDPDTGYERDYTPGAAYGRYFASRRLMFPARVEDRSHAAKQEVFVLRISGAEKAWPLTEFRGGKVLNERAGVLGIVVVGDAATRTVRAYRSEGRVFERAGDDLSQVASGGQLWRVEEDALHGENGLELSRLPGHLAYWFAWDNYFN